MDLVKDVRRLAAAGDSEYTIGGVTYWEDAEVEKLLVENSDILNLVRLETLPSWEEGKLVVKRARLLTAYRIEPEGGEGTVHTHHGDEVAFTLGNDGLLTFAEDQEHHRLYWSGQVYDVYSAAAELCEAWAAAVKLDYDVGADQQEMKRSQKHAQLIAQAKTLWASAPIRSVGMDAEL